MNRLSFLLVFMTCGFTNWLIGAVSSFVAYMKKDTRLYWVAGLSWVLGLVLCGVIGWLLFDSMW